MGLNIWEAKIRPFSSKSMAAKYQFELKPSLFSTVPSKMIFLLNSFFT